MDFYQFKGIAQRGKFDGKITFLGTKQWHRYLSVRISWFLYRMFPSITANTVSWAMIIMALLGGILTFFAVNIGIKVTVLITLYIGLLGDKIDGEIARVRNQQSIVGKYLDEIYHFFQPIYVLGLGYYVFHYNGFKIGMLCSIIVAAYMWWTRLRWSILTPAIIKALSQKGGLGCKKAERVRGLRLDKISSVLCGIFLRYDALLFLSATLWVISDLTNIPVIMNAFLVFIAIDSLVLFIKSLVDDLGYGLKNRVEYYRQLMLSTTENKNDKT